MSLSVAVRQINSKYRNILNVKKERKTVKEPHSPMFSLTNLGVYRRIRILPPAAPTN